MDLTKFWAELEDHFPPAGVDADLSLRIGTKETERLRSLGILASKGVGETYPCPKPGGEGCPRRLVPNDDGTYAAVCGVEPAECPTIDALAEKKVELIELDVDALAKALGRAIGVGARCEAIGGLAHTFRVGTFALEPGQEFPVYLAAQASPGGYATALRALAGMGAGRGFGVLAPTGRHISDDLEREMRAGGGVVLTLDRWVSLGTQGAFQVEGRPEVLLRGIGRPQAGAGRPGAEVVARAVFPSGEERDLTKGEYDGIVGSPGEYDFVVDEPGRRCWKRAAGGKKPKTRVNPTYFAVLKEMVASGRRFDPVTDSQALNERAEGVQTCRRMRQAFDIRKGKKRTDPWHLVQTVRTDDGRTAYRFAPAAGVSFAILFAIPR